MSFSFSSVPSHLTVVMWLATFSDSNVPRDIFLGRVRGTEERACLYASCKKGPVVEEQEQGPAHFQLVQYFEPVYLGIAVVAAAGGLLDRR